MSELAAFVGHSFAPEDHDIIEKFLAFFDTLRDMRIGFSWDHAEEAEPKVLTQKVMEKIEGKNLFIGICTMKELAIDQSRLTPLFWNKNVVKARQSDFSNKTSDWIIQEIGLAVGRGMNIILLVENGVHKLGGLQGDLEYIPFDRNTPEKAFTKLLEMIKALQPRPIGKDASLVNKTMDKEKEKEPKATETADKLTPNPNWKYEDYSFGLALAILRKKKEKEEEIFKKYSDIIGSQNKPDSACWQAEYLYNKSWLRQEDTLQRICDLSKEAPDNPQILMYIARIYNSYKQFTTAADYFNQAANLYTDHDKKIQALCDAALAYSKQNDGKSKLMALEQAKKLRDSAPNGNIILLETLTDIAEAENDADGFLAFSEAIINYKPNDHDHRFSLAYKYSELDINDLALYHYKLLVEKNPTGVTWNNLGAAQANLNLPGKAVLSYRASEKLGETLAMDNLANKLITAGFLHEAQEICDRATKMEDYDKKIGTAIARISETTNSENETEKELLVKTQPRRTFYTQYSAACTKPSVANFCGTWHGPDGDFTISVTNTILEAKTTVTHKVTNWLGAITSSEVKSVHISGQTFGNGIKYKQWIEGKETDITEGLMILADNLSEIHVYEKGSRSTEKFYDLKRLS